MTSTTPLSTTTPNDLRNWIDDGSAVLVDVREAGEYEGEYIVGSVSHPLSRLDANHLAESGFSRIVLTCASGARARKAGRILMEAGFKEVSYVDGGLDALKRAAFTVNANKNAPISIMRQVQMIVGGLSVTGALLGYAFHPGFYAIGAIVGLGLLFAGLSATCMMASVLARLSYNQIPNQQT
jgi:rhodanese-related sulfurtransferase